MLLAHQGQQDSQEIMDREEILVQLEILDKQDLTVSPANQEHLAIQDPWDQLVL